MQLLLQSCCHIVIMFGHINCVDWGALSVLVYDSVTLAGEDGGSESGLQYNVMRSIGSYETELVK